MEKFPIHSIINHSDSLEVTEFFFFFKSEGRKLTESPGEPATWVVWLRAKNKAASYDTARKIKPKTQRTAISNCCLACLALDTSRPTSPKNQVPLFGVWQKI